MGKEKSELEGKKYWKEKAERLQKENIILKTRIMYLELSLNVWSEGKSMLLDERSMPQHEPYGRGVWEINKD